jgi:hypothetical protein
MPLTIPGEWLPLDLTKKLPSPYTKCNKPLSEDFLVF